MHVVEVSDARCVLLFFACFFFFFFFFFFLKHVSEWGLDKKVCIKEDIQINLTYCSVLKDKHPRKCQQLLI